MVLLQGYHERTVLTYVRAFALCALIFSSTAVGQRVAVLTPEKSDASRAFSAKLEEKMGEKLTIIDDSMSEAAFAAAKMDKPFNMTAAGSRTVGTSMGCDFFILVTSDTVRRSSLRQNEYYESYAAVYAVSSRTGRLILWRLLRFEAAKPKEAEEQLANDVNVVASEIIEKLRSTMKGELTEPSAPQMEGPPDESSPAAKNFRAPIPYRRLKPEYTPDAFLYGVEATVEIVVDLGAKGAIMSTEIVRWAGYGLDESVEKTVRAMDWRPAERNGKPLAMRFLLRYNFKKLEKD
jgi:hypothetical protein